MKEKKHLTSEGLQNIVNIRASMNKGLSKSLKAAFPNTIPLKRPKIVNQVIKDPNWISGFATAESCFFLLIFIKNFHFREKQVKCKSIFKIYYNSKYS